MSDTASNQLRRIAESLYSTNAIRGGEIHGLVSVVQRLEAENHRMRGILIRVNSLNDNPARFDTEIDALTIPFVKP